MQVTGHPVARRFQGDDAVHNPRTQAEAEVAGHAQAKQGNVEDQIPKRYACGNDPETTRLIV